MRSQGRHIVVLIMVLALSVSLPGTVSAADEGDETRQQLADIEERLESTLEKLSAKEAAEEDLLGELEGLEKQVRRMQRRTASLQSGLRKLDKDIDRQKQELEAGQKEIDKLRGLVQERLVALYKSEEAGVLKILFSTHSTQQILEDYDYLSRIVRHDRELLTDYRLRMQARQASIEKLSQSRKKQQLALAGLKREETQLKKARGMKKRFLSAVRKDRDALDLLAGELRKRAASLNSLVKDLESGQGGKYTEKSSLFPLQKGLLPWPVEGDIKLGFGKKRHPVLGTLVDSRGIEIAVAPGTPIRAVWDGRIAFAKTFQGYGNLLIIDHRDGYYTLYAQASRLEKKAGDQVRQGDVVGVSGFEGAEHVYFEVRRGSKPLDPVAWISRR